MTWAGVLARAQRAAEGGMVDACVIQRSTGSSTDRDTGEKTPTYSTLYAGACRVQHARPLARPTDAGQDFMLLLTMEVHLPMSVVGLQVGDEITVTASVHDADLVGRLFRVHDLGHKSFVSARRVGVIEKTGS